MKKEELNLSDEQFVTTMVPGRFQRFMRQCVIWNFIRLIFFGFRSIGIILLNLRNEHEVPYRK